MFQPKTHTTLLFITILLITSLGNAFGFVACDHGRLSDIHHENHHTGEHTADQPEGFTEARYLHTDEGEDSCRDYRVQLSAGIETNNKNVQLPLYATLDFIFLTSFKTEASLLSGLDPYLKPPPISQITLTHRTIVLII